MANSHQNNLKNYDNFVRKDGVIKEQVNLENLTRRNYDKKWGYWTTLNDLCLEIAKHKGISESEYFRRIRFKRGSRITSITNWHVTDSPPAPITTTGEVGWRGSRLECSLEKFGPLYISPRFTLLPPDSEPEIKPTIIFLG